MKDRISERYDLNIVKLSRIPTGVGGQTYFLETENNAKYVLKGVAHNDKHVRNEPAIAKHLKEKGIPVSDYIEDRYGQYLWQDGEIVYHMQKYIEGNIFAFNEAPDWFMNESAEMLGKIHSALSDFKRLPTGMGTDFLGFMQSDHPKNLYTRTREHAKSLNDNDILADVQYRLSQINRLRDITFDLNKFTCCNTHGDYKVSQIICKDNHIAAIIDWTSACIHPICWEIIRSFTYASPSCKDGSIDINQFIEYVRIYLQYHALNKYDLEMMPYFFYYQILACDYYGQYYNSADENKDDFLFQAKFATKLIRWFETNVVALSNKLAEV